MQPHILQALKAAQKEKRKKKKKPQTQMFQRRGQNPQFSHSADLGQFSAWHGCSRWVKHPPTLPISALPLPHPQWVWMGGWPLSSSLWMCKHSALYPLPWPRYMSFAEYSVWLSVPLNIKGFCVVPETNSLGTKNHFGKALHCTVRKMFHREPFCCCWAS